MSTDRDLDDLRAAVEWAPDLGLAPLTDEERAHVHERLDALTGDRLAREAAHREHLAAVAHRLGRQVGQHLVTLPAAQVRLDALAAALDPDSLVAIALVPWRDARDLAARAFGAGFHREAVPHDH
jgi:hypothetical protein